MIWPLTSVNCENSKKYFWRGGYYFFFQMIIAIICSLIVIIILLIIFIYLWERRHKCKVHENVSYYEKDNYFNKPFFGPRESTPISFNPSKKIYFVFNSLWIHCFCLERFSTPCDAKRVVDAIWNASDDDFPLTEKVVELRGITLYRRDLLKLRSSDWINDEIINFYFAMLVDRAKHKSELPKVNFLVGILHFFKGATNDLIVCF